MPELTAFWPCVLCIKPEEWEGNSVDILTGEPGYPEYNYAPFVTVNAGDVTVFAKAFLQPVDEGVLREYIVAIRLIRSGPTHRDVLLTIDNVLCLGVSSPTSGAASAAPSSGSPLTELGRHPELLSSPVMPLPHSKSKPGTGFPPA